HPERRSVVGGLWRRTAQTPSRQSSGPAEAQRAIGLHAWPLPISSNSLTAAAFPPSAPGTPTPHAPGEVSLSQARVCVYPKTASVAIVSRTADCGTPGQYIDVCNQD